jgi:hypothetical protein
MPGDGAARCGVTAGARGVVCVLAAPGLGTTRTGDGARCMLVSPVTFDGGEYTGAGDAGVVCIPCAVAVAAPPANPIINSVPSARRVERRIDQFEGESPAARLKIRRVLMLYSRWMCG